MLTELTDLSHKVKEETNALQSKIKQNIQGTNSEGKETRTQTNDLDQKEEITNQNRVKKQEFRRTKMAA